MEEIRAKFARDLNCLVDEDRNKRRRALMTFTAAFGTGALSAPSVEYFVSDVAPQLAKAVSDSVEKNRELAVALFFSVFSGNEVSQSHLASLLCPVISTRLSTLPFPEVAEEVRLQLVRLFKAILSSTSCVPVINDAFDSVTEVLIKSASDSYHDVKIEVSLCIEKLCETVPGRVHMRLGALTAALVGNLVHQRAPVRLHALRGLGVLLPLGSDGLDRIMRETILDALRTLAFDRTASVRCALVQVVSRLLRTLPNVAEFEAQLVSVLLGRVADEQRDVQTVALAELNAACASQDATGVIPVVTPRLPAPFEGTVPPSTTAVIVRLLDKLVATALTDLGDWKAVVRRCAAGQLRSTIAVVGGNIIAQINPVFSGLCKSCTDEEADVRALVADCGALVGATVPVDAQLAVLLPQVRGEVSGLTASEYRASSLSILASVVSGASPDALKPHLEELFAALALPGCFDVDFPKICKEVLNVATGLITSCGVDVVSSETLSTNVAVVLLLLQASDKEADVVAGAVQLSQRLADCVGSPGLVEFYASNSGRVLTLFTATQAEWSKHSMYRLGFDALLRVASKSLADQMHVIVEVFVQTLAPSRDADLRIAMLALLDSFVGSSSMQDGVVVYDVPGYALAPFADRFVLAALVPNVVWRVGRVASTIRKVALACMFAFLRRGLLSEDEMRSIADEAVPVVKSCLGDDDAATRHVACLVLSLMFKGLPLFFDDMQVRDIYPELLKRLDDSSDQVRVAACTVLKSFAGSGTMDGMRGGPTEYTIDALLVHLDDVDGSIQEAAFNALVVYCKMEPAYGLKAAAEARARHRTPEYLDKLTALLREPLSE